MVDERRRTTDRDRGTRERSSDERERSSRSNGGGLQSRSSGRQRIQWRPTSDSVKKQADRSRSRFDSPFKGQMFVAKQGDNAVRILPPTWKNPDHYCFCNWQHRYIGPDEAHYLCPRKMKNERCPICDAEREARDKGDDERAKKYKPMQRWTCYVLDREGDNPDKPLIWDMNGYQDSDIVNLTKDRKTGAVIFVTDEEKGYDLTFRRSGSKDRTRYGSWQFDRDPSPLHDDADVTEEVINFITENPIDEVLRFFDAEYLDKMLYGESEEKDPDLDEEPQEERRETRRSRRDDETEIPGSRSRSRDEDEDAEEERRAPEGDDDEIPFDDKGDPNVRQARRPVARGRSGGSSRFKD